MRRYTTLLLTLSAIWGASYLFIKVGDRELEPATMMTARLLLAAALLLAYLVATSGGREAARELRAAWRPCVVLGAINAAIPFWLVGWGEKHVDSSVAGIAQATVPIFVLLLGLRFLPHDRVSVARVAGIALGVLGVVVLAGLDPGNGLGVVAGTLAVVLSSASYASGSIYGQLRVHDVRGPVLAAGSMLVGGLIMLPFGLAQLPSEVPSWKPLASVAALAVVGTAAAQLLLYRMLRLYGSARTTLVTYLMPCFALLYGVALLGEPLTAAALGGLALILAGVALASGLLRVPRRSPVPETS